MANDSLTNFIVLMNRQFWRSEFLLTSKKRHLYGAACCRPSIFGTIDGMGRKSFSSRGEKDDAFLWEILVHEPVRQRTDPPRCVPVLVGGQFGDIGKTKNKKIMISLY